MSLYDNLSAFNDKNAANRLAGRATSGESNLGYTPEMERSLAQVPIVANYRVALQGADGKFLFKVADNGTRTSGSFYIDSFGRFVAY
jgi:hypothetical protein